MKTVMLRSACVLLTLAFGLGTRPAFADVPKIVRDAVSAPVSELQVIDTGGEGAALRWATWMSGTQPGSNQVWLALLRREPAAAVELWSAARVDGYSPKITIVYSWYYSGRPTLMFTYQMGAEAEELELYGLNTNDIPVLLGKSSAVTFFPLYHDVFFIEAQGLLLEPTTCLFFDSTNSKLISKKCPK
jgi:hypothetical protein